MFGKKKKAISEKPIVHPILDKSYVLNDEDIERMFLSNSVYNNLKVTFDMCNKFIVNTGKKNSWYEYTYHISKDLPIILALASMTYIELLGGEPIEVNNEWYEYQIMANPKRGSIAELPEFSYVGTPFIYNFPLPRKITTKIHTFVNGYQISLPNKRTDDSFIGNNNDVCFLSIVSPSANVGTRVEAISSPISVDPILLANVIYRGKKYTYSLGHWDLKSDIQLMDNNNEL